MPIAFAAAVVLAALGLGLPAAVTARPSGLEAAVARLEPVLIERRRDIHRRPELSNREFRTSAMVAEHLRGLGMEVRTGIAHTGVVGILNAGKPGPMVALRADMDALPVDEQTGLPYASEETAVYNGQETGVMHACGHDAHVAILMTAAEVLASMGDSLAGSVMFIFQPAEEGAPEGEEGGAELMLEEGLFEDRTPDAVFGLHVVSTANTGIIAVHPGPAMAAEDKFKIVIHGKQTHGAKPWQGVDPIVTAAQVVLGLQTIASRQVDVTRAPSIISVGMISGGIRNNIIPDDVTLIGTIRTFDETMRRHIHERVAATAKGTAETAGGSAELEIDMGYPVTVNDPDLLERMRPTLERVAGATKVVDPGVATWAEDFSYYAQATPGLFIYLGVTAPDVDPAEAPANHSPRFTVDEDALPLGVRALAALAIDYLESGG